MKEMNEDDILSDPLKQHLMQHAGPETYTQGKSLVSSALYAFDKQAEGQKSSTPGKTKDAEKAPRKAILGIPLHR